MYFIWELKIQFSKCISPGACVSCGKQSVTPVDRKARIIFTEDVAYHYLYHSLFHCHHLKKQNPYPQSLLQAQILAKKKRKKKQLCSYEENAILDITKLVQKKRRALLLTILCHLPTRHLCIHWSDEELDHFSWLAVLFGGFSVSGLIQHDTKKLYEWVVFVPGEFTWPMLHTHVCPYR